jgi:hypothetical protein
MNMGIVESACREYRHRAGTWPTQLWQLVDLVSTTNAFTDGWGREIRLITYTNTPKTMSLVSYGADGLLGGSGSNVDVYVELH